MKNTTIKGYKVFDSDFKCRDYQFAENSVFKMEGFPKVCERGFHFCTKISHCFSYYSFDSNNIVCEVEAIGDVVYHNEDSKAATNHIKIGRRLEWNEVLIHANDGKNNTGHSNTGDSNTGDWNTGYSNTGYSNTGDRNTGDRNTGDRNTGDWNTGDRNTGDWNTGDSNTGYSNTGHRNTGAFCTGDPGFPIFNKPSGWTEQDFKRSMAYRLLCEVDTKIWIPDHKMTEEERQANRGWKTAEGFYRDIPYKEAFQNKWNNWNEESRKAFTSLPNFDLEIFKEITGVDVK